MKAPFVILTLAALCASSRCAGAQMQPQAPAHLRTQPKADPLATIEAFIQDQHTPAPSGPALTLDEVENLALTRNPEIHVAARRLITAQSHLPAAGALDDPQFMMRNWGVPLSQPWNFNDAQNMLMVQQSLPGPGKRTLRTSVARSEVDEAKAQLAGTRLQVSVQVRKAFYDLLRAQEELRIHDEHVGIARQAIQAARIRYTVGQVPQQDLLKAQLALTRLSEHMIRFDRDAEVARARLNALLGRDPETPIAVQGEFHLASALPSVESLEQQALTSRPDLQEAEAAAEKSRREQSLARKAYVPDFSVAGGYMLMPPTSSMRNSYMLEGSMTLPWFNHRLHDADIAASAAQVAQQDAAVSALRTEAFSQIQEALAEARASQRFAALYQDALRPQAEATLHAAVIAYENNQTDFLDLLDSQMTVIDIDLDWIQALADFNTRMADLELAVGSPVSATPESTTLTHQPATPEVHP